MKAQKQELTYQYQVEHLYKYLAQRQLEAQRHGSLAKFHMN